MSGWDEFKEGWREAAWGSGMVWRLTPLAFGLATVMTPECPWPRWVVWALLATGTVASALLLRKHWRKPENYVLRAFRDEEYWR